MSNPTLLHRLEEIAREHTLVPQLTQRMSDSLDFHDVSCVGLRKALEAAYKLGQQDLRKQMGIEQGQRLG